MSGDVELVVLEDPSAVAAAVADRLAASCAERRTHRAHRRQGTRAGVRGSGEARARLEQGRALVERRALRAAGRRAVELRASRNARCSTTSARRRVTFTGSRASSARSARQPTTSASSATRCSTSRCSASGPTATSRHLFPNAPTLQARRRVLPAEPGLEPFVDRVTLSHSGADQRTRDRLRARRRREGGRRAPRICGATEPRDPREPRSGYERQNHCNPRSRCCSQVTCLTDRPLYVELRRGRRRAGLRARHNADTRQA